LIVREFEKTIAALTAVLFIVFGILTLLFFNIERKAFSSSTYKQAFEQQGLYDRMPALLASALQASISQNPNAFPFLKELSQEDWQTTIASLLPPEELKAVADGTLDSTFDYINNRSDTVVISLLPIKARLTGPEGVSVIKGFLQTQPACTIEQLTQMGLGLLGGDIALCNPPPEALGLVDPLIQSQLQTINALFPDQVTLISGTAAGAGNDPRLQLHMVRSAIRFSPFFTILLLMTVAVLAVRSLRDFFVWLGWPLLVTGTIGGVIGLVGAPVIGVLLQFLIETQGLVFLPPLLASSIGQTASGVASHILVPVSIQGFVIAFLGLMMVIIGIFLPKPEPIYTY
jgi:hypothetical protein